MNLSLTFLSLSLCTHVAAYLVEVMSDTNYSVLSCLSCLIPAVIALRLVRCIFFLSTFVSFHQHVCVSNFIFSSSFFSYLLHISLKPKVKPWIIYPTRIYSQRRVMLKDRMRCMKALTKMRESGKLQFSAIFNHPGLIPGISWISKHQSSYKQPIQ